MCDVSNYFEINTVTSRLQLFKITAQNTRYLKRIRIEKITLLTVNVTSLSQMSFL